MTANEIADELNSRLDHVAANMLLKQEKELIEANHMIGVLREYIADLEKELEASINLNKAQAERKR